MKTSTSGRAAIEEREGRRLTAYRDTKGVLTIGVGHTGRMSPPAVTAGMTISEAECDAMLGADLAPVEAVINSAVKVPLTQNEFDAMVSLGFNVGVTGLKGSSVIRRLNIGDVAGAADAFLMWDRPPLLLARRKAERAQFLEAGPPGDNAMSSAHAVAAARAATLATMAETTHVKARATQSGSIALVVGGATAAATTHARHPKGALCIGVLVFIAAVCAAVVVARRLRAARTLAVNATKQAGLVSGCGTASTDLACSLER